MGDVTVVFIVSASVEESGKVNVRLIGPPVVVVVPLPDNAA
jgi:hypothetical protein